MNLKNRSSLWMSTFILVTSSVLMSCSSDEDLGYTGQDNANLVNDISLIEEVSKPVPTLMSVSDFIALVSEDCSKEELDFLSLLSPSDTMYVYEKSEKNYPRINISKLNSYKSILRTGLTLTKVESYEATNISRVLVSRSDMLERRTFSVGIKKDYNAIIEGNVSLMGFFSYMYDVLDDKAVSGYDATVSGTVMTDNNDPSLVIDYEPQNHNCDVMPDGLSLSYSMVGKIVLGAAFGDYAAGAPIQQISESGTVLIPPGGGN